MTSLSNDDLWRLSAAIHGRIVLSPWIHYHDTKWQRNAADSECRDEFSIYEVTGGKFRLDGRISNFESFEGSLADAMAAYDAELVRLGYILADGEQASSPPMNKPSPTPVDNPVTTERPGGFSVGDTLRLPNHPTCGGYRVWKITACVLGGEGQEGFYELIPLDKTEPPQKPLRVPCLMLETHDGIEDCG